jgi:hypothetical protein
VASSSDTKKVVEKLLGVVTDLTRELRYLQGRHIALETFAIEAIRSLDASPRDASQRTSVQAVLRASRSHLNQRLQAIAEKVPPGTDEAALACINDLFRAARLQP